MTAALHYQQRQSNFPQAKAAIEAFQGLWKPLLNVRQDPPRTLPLLLPLVQGGPCDAKRGEPSRGRHRQFRWRPEHRREEAQGWLLPAKIPLAAEQQAEGSSSEVSSLLMPCSYFW